MENRLWNPAELLQFSGGYWSACALHAGVKLDAFDLDLPNGAGVIAGSVPKE